MEETIHTNMAVGNFFVGSKAEVNKIMTFSRGSEFGIECEVKPLCLIS